MRDDVAPNRFLRVRVKHRARAAVDLGHDLIRDDDRNAELVRQALERAHEFGEVGLAGGEFASAGEIGAVEGGGRVDDEEGEAGFAHHGRRLVQELQLMIAVVRSCVGDVVEDLFSVESVPVGDGETADGTKGAFGIDVEAFAFAAAHVEGELAGDGEGVADLRFPGSELAEDFSNGAGFDAAGKEGVELFGAGGDGDEF